jgi:hypothetical protein
MDEPGGVVGWSRHFVHEEISLAGKSVGNGTDKE